MVFIQWYLAKRPNLNDLKSSNIALKMKKKYFFLRNLTLFKKLLKLKTTKTNK